MSDSFAVANTVLGAAAGVMPVAVTVLLQGDGWTLLSLAAALVAGGAFLWFVDHRVRWFALGWAVACGVAWLYLLTLAGMGA